MVAEGVVLEVELERALLGPEEEGLVVAGAVFAEVLEDLGQRGVGHGELEEVVHEGNDGVVGAAFTAERHGLVVVEAFVHDAVGEHGLGGDAEDEGSEAGVLGRP